MMGSTGKPTDKAGQVIANLEELNHQLDKEIAEYTALVDEVIWAINRLPESQHKVIVYRYIKGISWNEIAQTLNYAESYCYELNRKALKYLDNHS